MTSEAAFQAAQRRVEQAGASLEGARDTLAKTTIRSPMDGIVTARRVEEGEVAVIGVQNSPGTVLLTISDMSVVEAELEVDETSIPSVKLGQEAEVRLDAYPNQTFRGVVTEVGSSPLTAAANEAIKFKVKVRLVDPPAGIKPGLSARADILTGYRGNVLAVPLQALVVRDIERKPGSSGAGQRSARGGGGLSDGRGQGPLPADQDRPDRRPVDRGDRRAQGGRDGDHRTVQGPARARARRPREARGAGQEEGGGARPRALMDLTELLREALRAIRTHALRSFLTLLGIVIGVATLVGVVSVISGLNLFVRDKLFGLAPDVFVVSKFGIIRSREEFLDALKRPNLAWADFQRLDAELKKAERVGAQVRGNGAVKFRDHRLPDISVYGTTANYASLMNLDLAGGRFFLDSEERTARAVAIIGWDIKAELYPQMDPIGRTVLVNGAPYRGDRPAHPAGEHARPEP